MSEDFLRETSNCHRDETCIQTDKIYDSCRDKDCLEDLRVYLTHCGQELVDRAINVKARKAEVIWVYIDLEPVPFNDGYYTVDLKYFFKVTLDVFTGVGAPKIVHGLATFDKKVILFGSEGNAKKFTSCYHEDSVDAQIMQKSNLPKGVVECVEPIALNAKLVDKCKHHHHLAEDLASVPEGICKCFDDNLVNSTEGKIVLVTLGIFTIVKIEREVQLTIPDSNFCIPRKECIGSTDDDPCELFEKIKFPFDEFYPPKLSNLDSDERPTDCR